MYNSDTQKYLKYFYRVFKTKGISEPYTSFKFLLFKSKYFLNKHNPNKNELLIKNHNRLKLFPHFNKNLKKQKFKLSKRQNRLFIEDCFKRLNHFPIQYILKQWYFRKKIFYVDYNILIPRIETEKIVDIAFDQMKILISKLNSDKTFKINEKNKSLKFNFLEIGIGSGNIFISILKDYKIHFDKYFENHRKSSIKHLNLQCVGIDLNENCCLVSKVNSALFTLPQEEFEIRNISFEQYLENNNQAKEEHDDLEK